MRKLLTAQGYKLKSLPTKSNAKITLPQQLTLEQVKLFKHKLRTTWNTFEFWVNSKIDKPLFNSRVKNLTFIAIQESLKPPI